MSATKLLRWIGLTCLVGTLLTVTLLLLTDLANLFQPSLFHRQAGALALILIGASYLSLQFYQNRPRSEVVKGTLLSLAFLLWGLEQFLPEAAGVTIIDTLVVLIFVADLGLVILQRLRRDREPRDYL